MVMDLGIMEELSSMEELIDQADRRRQAELDMRVPVGAEISRSNIGGATIVETKQDSLARTANGTVLPGRTLVYYRLGRNSVRYVDTGRLAHHLAKRVNGERVFSLKPWPNAGVEKVYEKTCRICADGPQPVIKRFVEDENGDGETKYIAHMTTFHGMQWQTILRQEERDERREEQRLLRELMERVAGRPADSVGADVEALVQQRLAELLAEREDETVDEAEMLFEDCECGDSFSASSVVMLSNKLRMHRLRSQKHQTVAEG